MAVTSAVPAVAGLFRPPHPATGRLAGKVAIVVGAGQSAGDTIGNGRATALLFASAGASLLLVDRDVVSLDETRDAVVRDGGRAEIAVADITDEEQASTIGPACMAAFGRIDVLHNNVGSGRGDGGATRLERSTWDDLFATNVTGAFLTCKHVVPFMRAERSGVITNVSSVAATIATGLAGYKSSKAALNALTQHLAISNARWGIRANAIMPGLLDTPMAIVAHSEARGIDPAELREERDRQVPLGRMGTAWDTAYAALYLASDEAAFVTGITLAVDGGSTARSG